ncbi:MAG: hypothetical protein JHC71_16475, partial [Blastococcus sp.]|nr:hypothetical protein [Blastococcus sp.]
AEPAAEQATEPAEAEVPAPEVDDLGIEAAPEIAAAEVAAVEAAATESAPAEPAAPAGRPRRRRAASRPAGPPVV